MAHTPEVTNMALFCDFENIALGVQDAKYEKFDIGKVLERLLLKGSIVVKKHTATGSATSRSRRRCTKRRSS
jgi:hypothetical protein